MMHIEVSRHVYVYVWMYVAQVAVSVRVCATTRTNTPQGTEYIAPGAHRYTCTNAQIIVQTFHTADPDRYSATYTCTYMHIYTQT